MTHRRIEPIARNRNTLYAVALVSVLAVACRVWVGLPTWMHWDENYYLDIAQSYADRGELTPYMWRLGDLNIIAGSGSGYGITLLAGWLRLVGFSLLWGRMLMVVLSLLTALIMYKTASLWWHSRTAGLATLVFSLVSTSALYTVILKMDAIGILLYSCVLLLHVYAVRSRKWWLHFGLGIAAVATFEFHVLGLLYLLAFATYYGVCQLQTILDSRRLAVNAAPVCFALGALLAGTVYAVIHILPDPEAYFFISRHCFECNESVLVTEFKRLVRSIVFRPHEVVILGGVFAAALARRKCRDWHYAIVVAGYLVAQAVVGPPPYPHYGNHIWPLLALGVGGGIAWGFNYSGHARRATLGVIIAGALLTANIGMHSLGIYPDPLSYKLGTSETVEYISRWLPKDTVVMGRVSSFYHLQPYREFVSYRDGTVYGTMLRHESMLDFWRRVQPQAILLDEQDAADDAELCQYMAERGFVQIMPGLWLSEDQVGQGVVSQTRHDPARSSVPDNLR